MDMKKAEAIVRLATGLKRYEWQKIAHEINRSFDETSARVQFTEADADMVLKMLELENHE